VEYVRSKNIPVSGGSVDSDKHQALSKFYRDEFLRHIAQLERAGVLDAANKEVADKAYHLFTTQLDHLCGRACFPALAETLLKRFDCLTRLSELDPRQGH
jgi:hypothetical protein